MGGGESPGPHPGRKLRGLARGVSRPTPRVEGSPGQHPGGVCIPACTEADTSPGWLLPRAVLECILVLFADTVTFNKCDHPEDITTFYHFYFV